MMSGSTPNSQSRGEEEKNCLRSSFTSMFINMEGIFWVALANAMEILIE